MIETWYDPLYDDIWILSFLDGSWTILDPNGDIHREYNPETSNLKTTIEYARTIFELIKYRQQQLYDKKRDARCSSLGTSLEEEDVKFRKCLQENT